MKLLIDTDQRYAKMRAHTATHLLHSQLAKIFPNTKQAGSLVDSDLLRFDFYANNLLTSDEIREVERNINQIIYDALPVDLVETSFDEATKLGAKAFFEEKYGDEVRVIRVHNGDENVSVELCGGTHVNNTKDIGAFTIVSQEAVASGIKRITAYTGPKVIEKLHGYETILDNVQNTLDVKSYAQINEKVQKFVKENADLSSRVESLETTSLCRCLESAECRSNSDFSKIIQLPSDVNFKMLPAIAKTMFPSERCVLFFNEEGSYLICSDGSLSAKDLVKKYNLRGGGSDLSAQGKDSAVLNI